MKVEKRDGSDERKVLTGMIVDRFVLGRIASKWPKPPADGLFKSDWANLVGGWCVAFYTKYGKAPRKSIEGLFESWSSKSKDEDRVKTVSRFLEGLSEDYKGKAKEINGEYLVDIAGKLFQRVALSRLTSALEGDVDNGDLEGAEKRIAKFGKIELGSGAGVDIYNDDSSIDRAFDQKSESIIQYSGDLGKFFGTSLERGGFISFLSPEKRGKSFWLIDLADRAAQQRRKVAFFAVGDMTEAQMQWRFMVRAARHPRKPKVIRIPKAFENGQLITEEKEFTTGLERAQVKEAYKKLREMKIKSNESYLKLSCHAAKSMNVMGIRSILDDWERADWVPDVVVIDYADILASPYGITDPRDSIDTTWAQLRGLSTSRNILVVTATQSNAASYSVATLDMNNFSNDKRKFAHVTGMIGINQTADEKAEDITRLNWIVLREDDYVVQGGVTVAGCRAIGNIAMKSTFAKIETKPANDA